MAAQYDALGNYLGDWETEEERRKREEEIANTAVRTQEIKTYGDGTVERVTKEEVPGAAIPQAQPMAQPATKLMPVVPDQAAYNASIQQQESGARPDIGYHNPQLSSAYGPYGITQGAYADARRANPNLPENIAQATPEQMNQAQNAVTQNNARYLQSYGVEVNPQTLAAAHFLGAKGLADYLRDGTISAAAAKANGGAENVKRIVDQRLGGQAAPASGAAQAPTPVSPEELARNEKYSLATGQTGLGLQAPGAQTSMPAASATSSAPFINAYQTAQDNPMNLLKLRNDENVPAWLRERAGDRAYELMNMEVQKKQAQEQAKILATAAATGDRKAGNTIAKELQNQDGSWLKMILLGFISPQLAGEEAIKLGFGNKWVSGQDENGKQAMIQVNAKGLPLKGYTADGNEIATNDLVAYTTGVGKKSHELPSVHGGPVVNAAGEGGLRMYDPQSRQSYVQVGKERRPDIGWTSVGQAPGAVYNAAAAKTQGTAAGEGYIPTPVPGMPGVSGSGTAGMTGTTPPAATVIAAPAVTGTPAVPGTPAVTGNIQTPAKAAPVGTIAEQKQAEKIATKQAEERNTANQKYSDELAASRQTAAAQTSTINRLQTAIDKNPAFWGIDTNSAAWRAFVDVNSKDADRAESLNTLARNLNIPKSKRTEFDQVMNDYRALQVNAITGSGLTASQTNTERESQRVIGTIGSLADRPAAAKATLEYAKAKIDYTDAKARAWAEARKNNPGIDRLGFETNFDATQGEKIFKDANERMSKIISGQSNAGPAIGTEKDGWVFQGGNPADKNNWKRK